MLHAVTTELPSPSGPPLDLPTPPAPAEPSSAVPPGPLVPLPLMPPQALASPGQPKRLDGLAVAALCCGLAAFVPLVGVLAVVFGVVALGRLRSGHQRGRGLAIAGIVLGALGTLAWAAVIAFAVVAGEPETQATPSAAATGRSQVFVDKLKAGDCFSGGRKDQIDLVTAIPCSSPHESQVVAVIELSDGPYPGEAKVTAESEKGCTDKADPLLTDSAYSDLEPSYIYPDADTWRGDRSVLCLVEAPSGTTTGSALK
jgi:hypothetical protein